MKNSLKSRLFALLPGVAILASTFVSSAPVQADESKKWKYGAIGLGVLGAHLLSKGKEVEGAAALGGAYLAYKKGEKERQEARDDRYSNDWDRSTYDRSGYDRNGYDRNGYNRDGYSRSGYNRTGYDRNGYNCDGYNREGYHRDGYRRGDSNRDIDWRNDWNNGKNKGKNRGNKNGWKNPRNPHYNGR